MQLGGYTGAPGANRLWPRWTTVNSRIWLAP